MVPLAIAVSSCWHPNLHIGSRRFAVAHLRLLTQALLGCVERLGEHEADEIPDPRLRRRRDAAVFGVDITDRCGAGESRPLRPRPLILRACRHHDPPPRGARRGSRESGKPNRRKAHTIRRAEMPRHGGTSQRAGVPLPPGPGSFGFRSLMTRRLPSTSPVLADRDEARTSTERIACQCQAHFAERE